jgi:hypothetical protein
VAAAAAASVAALMFVDSENAPEMGHQLLTAFLENDDELVTPAGMAGAIAAWSEGMEWGGESSDSGSDSRAVWGPVDV